MTPHESRILTTHVGSLIRPAGLLEHSNAAKDSPELRERYEQTLRRSVAAVVEQQLEAGIDIVNDGEFGKSSWANYVLERLTGFERRPDSNFEPVWLGRDRRRFRQFMEDEFPRGASGVPRHVCVAPITYCGHDAIRRTIAALEAALAAAGVAEGFLTAVAPGSACYDSSNEFYRDDRDYVFAIAEALREEYLEIVNAGFILQVDDALLANMYDELVQHGPSRFRQWAELRIAALNHALRGIPEERIRYHVCFGSWHVPHVADAPLDALAPLIVKVRAGAYAIEAANVRHEHEWRVWQTTKLPPRQDPDLRSASTSDGA